MRSFSIISLGLFLFSCSNSNPSKFNFKPEEKVHFSIDTIGEGTYVLEVNRPFVSSNHAERYCLFPQTQKQPQIEGVTHFISTPIERVAITSTTHLGFLEPINQLGSIVGATNLSLFYSSNFQYRVAENEIISLGNAEINEEQLIQLNVDVVFSYAINAGEIKKVEQLRKLGQKVILVSEYMEQEPLAKAAWINFIAAFYDDNTIQYADSIYENIEEKYKEIEKLANSTNTRPSVIIGYPWKGNWYVSGGKSFQAAYFESANVEYIWNNLEQEGSVPLATETVIKDGIEADYWINCGSKQSLAEIVESDAKFNAFEAFKLKKVYNNYKRSNAFGANDYWESGVMRPDLVLSDLIKIMHPELLKEHELVYYSPLK